MSRLLSEILKYDLALAPVEIAPDNDEDTPWYDMSKYRRAVFVVSIECEDGLELGEVLTVTANEAVDAAGTDEDDMFDFEVEGAVQGTVVSVDIGGVPVAGDIVTVNGQDFVEGAAADWETAAELAAAITASDLGLTAAEVGTVVTITPTVPGTRTVTVVLDVDGASTVEDPLTHEAIAYAEVHADHLSPVAATGVRRTTVSLNIDNPVANANDIVASVVLVRGVPYSAPVRQVDAASGVST